MLDFYVNTRIRFSLRDKRLFEITEVEITRVDCILKDKSSVFLLFFLKISEEPGLVDRVLALHAGSRGFDSHLGHMSEWFFRSNRPGYSHPVSSELENSGIRVTVSDCSVTERRRWRPPYQTGKTVHMHAKHYKHNEDGRTAPSVCGNGSVPLPLGEGRYENWNKPNGPILCFTHFTAHTVK